MTLGQTATDASSTITLGGTAQNIIAAGLVINGFQVSNPDAANDLWVSWSTTALANGTGSHRVAANGGEYVSDFRPLGSVAISLVGAVTGQKFTATYW